MSKIGFGVVPSVPDGGSELLSRSESATPESILHNGVQNEVEWCPKWGLTIENGKLKVES